MYNPTISSSWSLLCALATTIPTVVANETTTTSHDEPVVTYRAANITDDDASSSSTVYLQTMWLWSSSILFLFMLYFVIVLSSYPFVRYRTGIPVLFLVLIIVFPPSFFFLLVYLAILRLGYLSALWFVLEEREVQERETRRVARLTQRERRALSRA